MLSEISDVQGWAIIWLGVAFVIFFPIFFTGIELISGKGMLKVLGFALTWPISIPVGLVYGTVKWFRHRNDPVKDEYLFTISPIDGPRATIKPEEREAFDADVKRLLDRARQRAYGRATTIDGKRSGVSGEQRDVYQQNVARIREQAKRRDRDR